MAALVKFSRARLMNEIAMMLHPVATHRIECSAPFTHERLL